MRKAFAILAALPVAVTPLTGCDETSAKGAKPPTPAEAPKPAETPPAPKTDAPASKPAETQTAPKTETAAPKSAETPPAPKADATTTTKTYTCKTCGGTFDKPGKCDKCGMDLVEKP